MIAAKTKIHHDTVYHDRIDECRAAMHDTMARGNEAAVAAAQHSLGEEFLQQRLVG
jgi:hypothetical protein